MASALAVASPGSIVEAVAAAARMPTLGRLVQPTVTISSPRRMKCQVSHIIHVVESVYLPFRLIQGAG